MDILTLAAKDGVVRIYGYLTMTWSEKVWLREVELHRDALLDLPHHELEEVLNRYPDSPDNRDSDDLPK